MKKSVLFTTHQLVNYAGSELNILELAVEFQSRGWDVQVATFILGLPIVEEFKKKGIKTYDILNQKIGKASYDLIWAQHTPVLEYVLFNKNIQAKKIVHSSLSFFEPLEVPPVFANDLTFSVVNCRENMKVVESYGIDNAYLFHNFIPEEYMSTTVARRTHKISQIAVVSNHVPKEIVELANLFKKDGVNFDIFGYGYTFRKVTPDLLKKYDLVISIGKTVQYCFGMGIPVFVYDHFGGPGWISKKNFDREEYYNFSGRSTKTIYSASRLKNLIISEIDGIRKEQLTLAKLAKERYSLRSNLDKLLLDIQLLQNISREKIDRYSFLKRSNDYYIRELTTRNWYKQMYERQKVKYSSLKHELMSLSAESDLIRNELQRIHAKKIYKMYLKMNKILSKYK